MSEKKPRRNSKEERIDLSHLSFEEAIRQSWEAEPPPKKKREKKETGEAGAETTGQHNTG